LTVIVFNCPTSDRLNFKENNDFAWYVNLAIGWGVRLSIGKENTSILEVRTRFSVKQS
jgi:hypothetical protein